MSVTAADTTISLEGELQSAVDPPESSTPQRQQSKALSISSLSDESKDNAIASEACRDVDRELAAINTRLSAFQRRRQRKDNVSKLNAVAPLEPSQEKAHDARASPSSSVSSSLETSSPIFSKLSKAQQETEAVAEQVATTLMKCDQLLQRAKSCDTSRVSSASSIEDRSRVGSKAIRSRLSESMASSASSVWDVKTNIEDEELLLSRKAAAVKRLAVRCQRDIETSTVKIELHHQQTQESYLKELQRKYDSKKHMTLMKLREKYEKETKTLVRAKMDEYELEEATAVKKTRHVLMDERHRALNELQTSHNTALEESLSHLEMQLLTETERDKQELRVQLQEELTLRLKQLQDDSQTLLKQWEEEQRQKLEQELYDHREAAVASVLKAQEERTAVLKRELQTGHNEKQAEEVEKLHKALAFGTQAQLQQLRSLLETEHEEKMNEIKTDAQLSLDKETEKLKKMLTRSHREQQDQLQRDLEKKNRVAIMELHDTMQASHQESCQALKDAAEQRRMKALEAHRHDLELECRQELETLKQTLDQDMATKLRQLEMGHAEECELKLEQLRARAVTQHARELDAKRSRMIQCKNVLLAEATAFLTFDNNLSDEDRSKANPEDNSAAVHLLELKKHLSKELAQYVDVMIAEFDELAEEQQILVAKITESTQLYLSYKRQCGVLEAQSEELTSGLETLHDQLQKKDGVCRKLYQANEALLKRLQLPALEASAGTDKSDIESPRVNKSPTSTKTRQIVMAALPSINGKFSDNMTAESPETRLSSSTTTVRQAFRMKPKSAGATSAARRSRHSQVAMTSSWQQHEKFVQRPSSSSVARRTERAKEPEIAFQGDSRDEVQQLKDENDLLRSKLVEKMRGQSKVVAGGQYRAASASPVAKVPFVPGSGCSKCSIARTRAIKAHQESEQTRAAAVELREYVDKIEASQQRLWEERSSHVHEIAKLREKVAQKVEHCILVEAECAKLDNQVRRLRSENEIITQPFKNKDVVDKATQCALQQSYEGESNADRLQEISSLKAELLLLIQQREEREQEQKRVFKDLEEFQITVKLEKDKRLDEAVLWRAEKGEYERRILQLEESNRTLAISVQDLQQTRQNEVQLIQRTNVEIRENMLAKEAEIQQLVKQHKTETLAVEQRNQTLVKALKVRIEQKVADVEKLHALLTDHSTVKTNNAAMKRRMKDLEAQIQSLICNNDLQQQQTADLAQIERNKLLNEAAAEQHRLSEALSTLQQENRALKTRVSEVEAELNDRDEVMQRQKRFNQRAMERLFESSLRLCVVAPTVNVQLNTNGASMGKKDKDSSELTSIICKSTPQEDSIKRLIENDVLPQFTSVFLQKDDDGSPQVDVPMTRWLQELLHDMQARIATQLESIYSSATSKSHE
ncbi:hypothetical protein GN244_ATG10388 [Phytophthora infestans]|uniref:Uncharacterized protein n=1 Tax=Phytophthora infestans TaxID=4787 RepID=A0A833S9D3_PHYIN|nr:hypothetical protein GN244_ATG10388 [Phytophthora infestans]